MTGRPPVVNAIRLGPNSSKRRIRDVLPLL
jgi:hypothetical protein